jgi:hypothetical protein
MRRSITAALASILLAGCSRPSQREAPATAEPRSAAPEAGAATVFPDAGSAPFHCFSWIHLEGGSTDCYRTDAECEAERAQMERGARPTAPCRAEDHASCTVLPGGQERCFGDAANCARYRAFVGRNGLRTAECAAR